MSVGKWLRRLLKKPRRDWSHRTASHSTPTSTLEMASASGAPKLLKRMPALTPREQDVVRLVCLGYSNKQIAQELGLKVTTVKWNMTNILAKFEVQSSKQLIVYLSKQDGDELRDWKLIQ